jgi:hypothetical protein
MTLAHPLERTRSNPRLEALMRKVTPRRRALGRMVTDAVQARTA